MRFSVAAVASLLACVVSSQTIQGEAALLPSCALTCLTNAISAAGCSLTDYACQCGSHKPAIQQVAAPCIVSACNTTDALATQKIAMEICQLEAAQGSNSSSSSSSSAISSTNGSIATASSASSIASSIGSTIVPATTTSVITTPTPSPTTSPTPAASKAAAPRLEAFGAIAGAAVLAAFAL